MVILSTHSYNFCITHEPYVYYLPIDSTAFVDDCAKQRNAIPIDSNFSLSFPSITAAVLITVDFLSRWYFL